MLVSVAAVIGCSSEPVIPESSSAGSGSGGGACAPIDDQNPCTDDVCENGAAIGKPTAAGTSCSTDGERYCDGSGACVALACSGMLGFSTNITAQISNYPVSIAVPDLNGDSKPDLAIASANDDSVSVLLAQENGTFAAGKFAVGTRPVSVAAADMNGDGKPDLVVANQLGGSVSLLLNEGDGTFAAAVSIAKTANPSVVVASDFDGDGKPDLAVAGTDLRVLRNLGNGTFASAGVV